MNVMNKPDQTYYYTAVVLTVVVTLAAVALLAMRALSTGVPFFWVAAAIPISVAVFAFRRSRLPSVTPTAARDLMITALLGNSGIGVLAN